MCVFYLIAQKLFPVLFQQHGHNFVLVELCLWLVPFCMDKVGRPPHLQHFLWKLMIFSPVKLFVFNLFFFNIPTTALLPMVWGPAQDFHFALIIWYIAKIIPTSYELIPNSIRIPSKFVLCVKYYIGSNRE